MSRYISVGAAFLAAVVIVLGIVAVNPGEGGASGTAATGDVRVTMANGTIVEVDLVARETTQEIAPGVDY